VSRTFGATSGPIFTPLKTAAALSAVLAAATVTIVLAPDLRLQVEAPNLRPALEAAGAVAAGLTAGIAYVRFVLGGERVWLYVSTAFLVIAVNRLVIGVAVPPDRIEAETASYLWTAARFEMGALLLMGALAATRGESEPSPRPLYGAVAFAALLVLAALDLLIWVGRDSLPALIAGGASTGHPFTGVQPGLTLADLALGSAGAGLFLLTAFLYAREPALDRRNRTWLACVLVLAAFSHIHYMLVPTAFRHRVSTGDALRLAMSVVLLLALFDEIRRALTRETERSRELEAAYEVERVRVEELEGLARTKADLLRMLTHELLHPVAAIRTLAGGLSLGERKLDDEAKRRAVEAILEQSKQLRDLVERAPQLDELRFDTEPAAVDQRVDELVEHVRHTFPQLGERLRVELEPDAAAATVRTDPGRIMQVFHNLLSNADKFAPAGSAVDLAASCRDDEVVFEVRDAGRGIPLDRAERCFDAFVRLPNATGTDGSGIGLFIVRSIVEAHGGRVWVGGGKGRRSTMAFALPRVEAGAS
jgi:signal transduction histidine kinase